MAANIPDDIKFILAELEYGASQDQEDIITISLNPNQCIILAKSLEIYFSMGEF